MKEQILKIAKDLEKGSISSTEAQNLLLCLFGVSNNEVTVCDHKEALERGHKMCEKCSKWLI